jgi:hypothetical protein
MAEQKDPKSDSRFLWVYRRIASSLTEARYAEKLKINFFNDDNIMYVISVDFATFNSSIHSVVFWFC